MTEVLTDNGHFTIT